MGQHSVGTIDMILYRNVRVTHYGTLMEKMKSGRMMSDHYPVLARFLLKGNNQDNKREEKKEVEDEEDALLAQALEMSKLTPSMNTL